MNKTASQADARTFVLRAIDCHYDAGHIDRALVALGTDRDHAQDFLAALALQVGQLQLAVARDRARAMRPWWWPLRPAQTHMFIVDQTDDEDRDDPDYFGALTALRMVSSVVNGNPDDVPSMAASVIALGSEPSYCCALTLVEHLHRLDHQTARDLRTLL